MRIAPSPIKKKISGKLPDKKLEVASTVRVAASPKKLAPAPKYVGAERSLKKIKITNKRYQ